MGEKAFLCLRDGEDGFAERELRRKSWKRCFFAVVCSVGFSEQKSGKREGVGRVHGLAAFASFFFELLVGRRSLSSSWKEHS